MSFSGWLLCRPWLIHSHMRPQVHFLLFIFLCCSIRRPKRREILPLIRSKLRTPPSQPWSYCCLQLSVDFLGILIDWWPPKAKAMPNAHRSIFWWGIRRQPKGRNRPRRRQTRWRKPLMNSWWYAAPKVGDVVDVATAIEGKAICWRVGRRWLILFVACVFCVACCDCGREHFLARPTIPT